MDLKLYALLMSKIRNCPEVYSGLPAKTVIYNPDHSNHNLFNNTHIEITSDENRILNEADIMFFPDLVSFGVPADASKSSAITVTLNIPSDDFTVSFYTSEYELVWSAAEPVFTAGNTYYMSFVTMPGKKLLGAWAEVKA